MLNPPNKNPIPPNQQRQLPRLKGGRNLAFLRKHHLDGTIPTYWGPKQPNPTPGETVTLAEYFQFAIDDGETTDEATIAAQQSFAAEAQQSAAAEAAKRASAIAQGKTYLPPDANGYSYVPPGDWPNAGTLLRTPRVARFFWESADVQTQCTIAAGFTGSYSFGQHFLSYDVDATGPPGDIPVHSHTTTLDQHGTENYGIQFSLNGSGFLDVGGGESYQYTSVSVYWEYEGYIPPFILEEYEDRTSLTYLAIQLIWIQVSSEFVPFQPYSQDGLPPINFTQTGSTSVGLCLPVLTGVIFINDIPYGTPKDLNTVGLTIPDGWAQPPELASLLTNEETWTEVAAEVAATLVGSTNPYWDSYDVTSTNGMDDFLEIVTPVLDGYYATNCINFLLFSTYHPIPLMTDPRVQRIIAEYPNMPGYNVIVLLDIDNFTKLAQINATGFDTQLLIDFPEAILQFVEAMTPYGWKAAFIGHNDPDAVVAIMEQYMHDLLPLTPIDAYPNTKIDPEEVGNSSTADGSLIG